MTDTREFPSLGEAGHPDCRGIDLEIYEWPPLEGGPAELGVIKPNRIRINGVECVTREGVPVVIDGLLDKSKALTATMTIFVRSLKVHAEEPTA